MTIEESLGSNKEEMTFEKAIIAHRWSYAYTDCPYRMYRDQCTD